MIDKIELEENNNNFDTSIIIISVIDKLVIQIKNDITIKKEKINTTVEELTDLVKKYATYWDYEYINNEIIDGTVTTLKIYDNNEIIKYTFKNKYPNNYNEFIKSLKTTVGII